MVSRSVPLRAELVEIDQAASSIRTVKRGLGGHFDFFASLDCQTQRSNTVPKPFARVDIDQITISRAWSV
jgi:hypothetical protein